MKTSILQAPVCELNSLRNLFIELTAKNCNQHCRFCYIDFPMTRNVKDFIPIELVKNSLLQLKNESLQCIYLTGAEPLTHPDFNSILRLCLKKSSVCICTNGSFINEKKARFFRRVQDEGINEIIFKLSMVHYNELKNDEIRSRGSFRQVLHAIKHLIKYDFNPIIQVSNYYKESEDQLLQNFKTLFSEIGFEIKERNISINEWYDKNSEYDEKSLVDWKSLDCEYGRILTTKGIYSCPFLANDHRGRCGSDFNDFAKKVSLDSLYCNTCLKNKRQVFAIDFSSFNS